MEEYNIESEDYFLDLMWGISQEVRNFDLDKWLKKERNYPLCIKCNRRFVRTEKYQKTCLICQRKNGRLINIRT